MTTSLADNGVNVEALLGARDAFADTPEIAQFQWRSTVTWVNGTHSQSSVETFYGFGEEQQHRQTFAFDIDHPLQFAAQDNGITPVEYVLVALGGCLTAGIAAVAQQRQIQLRSVQASVAAEMDLHGILGADPDVRNGFSGVKVTYEIDADATAEEIRGAGRAVAEALRGLRHPHQPDRRHRRGRLIAPSREMRVTTTTVVVGAGHCGLAMSRCLAERSIDHVVLERGEVAQLVAHPALGLPAPAHPELDDPTARLRLPRRRPGRLPAVPEVVRLIEDYAARVGGARGDRHHGHRGPTERRRIRGAHRPGQLARADGGGRHRRDRGRRTCRSGWPGRCPPGSPR